MITKTQKILDRVDGERGILLLLFPLSILLIIMMKKFDEKAMITKTQETLDRVDGERGILLLYSVKKSGKTWFNC